MRESYRSQLARRYRSTVTQTRDHLADFGLHCTRAWRFLLSFKSMLIYRDCIPVFKCFRGLAPDYPANKFKKRSEKNKNQRKKERTFHYRAVLLWNSLPERLTELTNLVLIQKGTYASFIKRILEALL